MKYRILQKGKLYRVQYKHWTPWWLTFKRQLWDEHCIPIDYVDYRSAERAIQNDKKATSRGYSRLAGCLVK